MLVLGELQSQMFRDCVKAFLLCLTRKEAIAIVFIDLAIRIKQIELMT